jgi:hypothetical protein
VWRGRDRKSCGVESGLCILALFFHFLHSSRFPHLCDDSCSGDYNSDSTSEGLAWSRGSANPVPPPLPLTSCVPAISLPSEGS